MSENKTFKLPDLGEGLTEADLSTWMVAVGDQIELNQIIAEVETAKAAVDLPSPYAGEVVELLAVEGQTIDVGSPIIVIATVTDAVTDTDPVQSGSAASGPSTGDHANDGEVQEKVPVLVGYGVAGATRSKRPGRRSREAIAAPTAVAAARIGDATPDRPQAKPPVRKLARDKGVDLQAVRGTGPGGRVTRENVLEYAAACSTETPPGRAAPASEVTTIEGDHAAPFITRNQRETRVPIRGVRKHTAQAMVRSAFTAPHVTEFITVDVTATMELIARLKASKPFDGVKLTPLAVVGKILLVALRDNPTLNSEWDEDAQEIVLKHYVNLGIAAATPRGLMVPNIKDADQLGLRDLAMALGGLTATAKEGKTTPADLAGGTITITNVGVFGVDTGTPILNPGEAAILCMGAIRKQPWVVDDSITVRSMTTLSLSFDHRLVDGQQGSQLLADIAGMLEDPLNLIALA